MRRIKEKKLFDENTYKKIYPCEYKADSIYGFLKRKMLSDFNDLSLTPIISSIGTYSYNLAKFLIEMIDAKEHCAEDSFSF